MTEEEKAADLAESKARMDALIREVDEVENPTAM